MTSPTLSVFNNDTSQISHDDEDNNNNNNNTHHDTDDQSNIVCIQQRQLTD